MMNIHTHAASLSPPRRQQQAAQAIDLGGVEFGFKNKNKFNIPDEDNPDGLRSPRPLAYRVEFTDPPTTVPFPREFEVSRRACAWVAWPAVFTT